MPERLHALRLFQHHLRQAGSLIAAGDLDGAASHIDAALAIDPASLPALMLRDRVRRSAATIPAPSRTPPVPTTTANAAAVPPSPPAPPASRYVPRGVDPRSWVSFETRIAERRFRSLIASVQEASARGDGVAARMALEEARELQPDAAEVEQLEDHVALLPAALPVEVNHSLIRTRTLRAAGILLFGVTLVMGLDWLRSDQAHVANADAAWEVDTAGRLDGAGVAASVTRRTGPSGVAEFPVPPSSGTSGMTAGVSAPVASPGITARELIARADRQPVGEADRVPAVRPAPEEILRTPPSVRSLPSASATPSASAAIVPSSREIPDDFVVPRITIPGTATPRATPLRGEVPDDYVAPPSSLLARAAPESSASRDRATASLPAVVRGPTDVTSAARTAAGTASTPVRPSDSQPTANAGTSATAAAPAAAAAAAVITRPAEVEVTTALEQYARAYGRLDARAARDIWPTVNERALAEAFAGLESQSLTFEHCDIEVQGPTANASCQGSARYVVRVGSREPRTEPRSWRIALKQNGEGWVIDDVRTSR